MRKLTSVQYVHLTSFNERYGYDTDVYIKKPITIVVTVT